MLFRSVGDETMEVKGVPRFKAGERVILFAEKNGRQFCPLVGIHHGKLLLERDAASGSEILIRHTGRPLISVGEFGSEDGGHGIVAAGKARSGPPMSVERFLSAIRSELLKGRMR